MKLVSVKDNTSFVRDMDTGALLLKNKKALLEYEAEKRKMAMTLQEKKALEDRLSRMESSLQEMQCLLRELASVANVVKSLKERQ
jgi:type I restriction-modification system DNA methylase subunit